MSVVRRIALLAIPCSLFATPCFLFAQTYPKGNDPRDGLKPGMYDAGSAASGMRLVSFSRKGAALDSASGLTFVNSDLAFRDHYVYQGNFAGFMIWDVKDPAKPVLLSTVSCITSQGDPSIIGNLLLVLGAAAFVGGLGRVRQTFSATGASAKNLMLLIAVAALVMP